ncbi:hypothetical protein G7068_12100 [Leucobacter viscericola]|uniref:Uncharacterized protein n=1 Tax=Leucobacter viscericola TaxID=2714935 RepID=A0A6G7XHK8_9MICO|nr:hypothetical protein [Leucobacter viscericola]QIK62357.1 hypothetical protein G7068_03380 [Leucobacter viscericola]QIK63851.1 hypothetical protein G7068_12100 [Leucobacter viscericola]
MANSREVLFVESFRRTLRDTLSSGDKFALGSLLASAEGIRVLAPVVRDELAPVSGELELHLTGKSVIGHAANAEAFSELVRRIAASTKHFVKDRANSVRQTSELLVDTGPGSVRVTFKAPSRTIDGAVPLDMELENEILHVDDTFSEALRRIAVVLANSDPESPGNEALGAAIEQLPPSARNELAHALDPIRKQGWDVTGTFAQRGLGTSELSFGKRHAEYLKKQLKAVYTETETWTSTGRLDGHRWSNGLAYFSPSGQPRTIPASYASAELQSRAAEIAADENNKVEAKFNVHIKRSMSNSTAKRSYELISVRTI